MATKRSKERVVLQGHDPRVMREEAYADDSELDIRRRTHQLYTVDPVDFAQWTLERLSWRGDERVLDMGCGPGDLLREMSRRHGGWELLAGFDISPGMIAEAIRLGSGLTPVFFAGNAQAIPFPDGTFDVVMARHMLYHVPDIDQALAEAARVLRAGGHLLATTNSQNTMPEYHALCARAAARFPAMVESDMITDRFSLENAPSLFAPYFSLLEVHTLPGILRFPTNQPLMDYFASSRALIMRSGHTEAEWHAVLDFVRSEADAAIAREGRFDVTKVTGAIVGVKEG